MSTDSPQSNKRSDEQGIATVVLHVGEETVEYRVTSWNRLDAGGLNAQRVDGGTLACGPATEWYIDEDEEVTIR